MIHTVGPQWIDGMHREPELLASCYRTSLALAEETACASVAFPIISAGTFGFPKDQALQIAIREISDFLLHHEMLVYLVVHNRECYRIGKQLFADIAAYIDDHYVDTHVMRRRMKVSSVSDMSMPLPAMAAAPDLQKMLDQIDESFSQMLLRKIDEKGMKDAERYKKVNVDRKLFSKIRNDVHYKPNKATAIAFAVALELPLTETNDLLRKAGYALSHANIFDIIIEYFIRSGNYNIFEINEALFAFDQSLLGKKCRLRGDHRKGKTSYNAFVSKKHRITGGFYHEEQHYRARIHP